jgi:hypothetical protein
MGCLTGFDCEGSGRTLRSRHARMKSALVKKFDNPLPDAILRYTPARGAVPPDSGSVVQCIAGSEMWGSLSSIRAWGSKSTGG